MHPGEFPMAMACRSLGAKASLDASQADSTILIMEMLERCMSSDGFCNRPTPCPFSQTPPIPSEIPRLLVTRPAGCAQLGSYSYVKIAFSRIRHPKMGQCLGLIDWRGIDDVARLWQLKPSLRQLPATSMASRPRIMMYDSS
jgi:hypothetical protein